MAFDYVYLSISNLPVVEIELDPKLLVDLLRKEDGSLNGNDTIVADAKVGL